MTLREIREWEIQQYISSGLTAKQLEDAGIIAIVINNFMNNNETWLLQINCKAKVLTGKRSYAGDHLLDGLLSKEQKMRLFELEEENEQLKQELAYYKNMQGNK